MWATPILLLWGLGSPLASASCAHFSRERYCAAENLAIVGVVTGRGAAHLDRSGFTLTEVTVQIERTLQGPESMQAVTFPVVGGLGGAPRLAVGERYALVLAGPPGAAALICGTAQALDPTAPLRSGDALRAAWAARCAEEGASGPPVIPLLAGS